MTPVAGLVVVDAAEALDVVDDDDAKGTVGTLGVGDHLLERLAAGGRRAADGVVDVVAGQRQSVRARVLRDGVALVGDRLFLAVGAAAEVADGDEVLRRTGRPSATGPRVRGVSPMYYVDARWHFKFSSSGPAGSNPTT